MKVNSGLEVFLDHLPSSITDKKVGLLANPASVTSNLTHAKKLIQQKFRDNFKAIFSPQHGFHAEKQDNMILSDHIKDRELNIPIFSLYHNSLKPSAKMLEEIDILLIDIQDVGTRVYTFIYTISYCLEAAKEYNKKVIILDRPNPLGGLKVEGNILEEEYSSFVGRYKIPMRHGMTCGELAQFINIEYKINADLEIIRMRNWKRSLFFKDTGLPWILPSPNLPIPESAYVYPGQVIFEGTNISEGRGTTRPFEFFGAPFIDQKKLKDFINNKYPAKGVILREIIFQPTSGKWQDISCTGFQIHIVDNKEYEPYFLSLSILQGIIALFKKDFLWKEPPYEFEHKKMPIDLILGSKKIRTAIEAGEDLYHIRADWEKDLLTFKEKRSSYLLYK